MQVSLNWTTLFFPALIALCSSSIFLFVQCIGEPTFRLGGAEVSLLSSSYCETLNEHLSYDKRTRLSVLMQHGLQIENMEEEQEACEVMVKVSPQLGGDPYRIILPKPVNKKEELNLILVSAVKQLLAKQAWMYNMFYFSFQCPSKHYCFHSFIWDDTRPSEFRPWLYSLDKQARCLYHDSPPFSIKRTEPGHLNTMKTKYEKAKKGYVEQPKNESRLLRFLTTLVWADAVTKASLAEHPPTNPSL